MAILQKAHCQSPPLKTLNLRDGTRQIVIAVDTSLEVWGAILTQEDENKVQQLCHFESGLCNIAERRCDMGKRECHHLLKALEKFRNYVNGVRFLVETDYTIVVLQLNLPTNLP
jgi:hypothetical protein